MGVKMEVPERIIVPKIIIYLTKVTIFTNQPGIYLPMKKKILLVVILLFQGLIIPELNAQSLIIKFNDGSENTEPLDALQKLTFFSNNLVVNFISGSTDAYGLETIRKLYFNPVIFIGEKDPSNTRDLGVYPNPGSTFITVRGIPEGAGSVTFYGPDGRVVMTKEVTSGQATIDVSRLQPGLYLLHALGHTAKFVRL